MKLTTHTKIFQVSLNQEQAGERRDYDVIEDVEQAISVATKVCDFSPSNSFQFKCAQLLEVFVIWKLIIF